MKNLTLTKENYELLIGCIEESLEKEREHLNFWQARNDEDAVKEFQKDIDKLQNLLKELKNN